MQNTAAVCVYQYLDMTSNPMQTFMVLHFQNLRVSMVFSLVPVRVSFASLKFRIVLANILLLPCEQKASP